MQTKKSFKYLLKLVSVILVAMMLDSCAAIHSLRYLTLISQGSVSNNKYTETLAFEYKMGGIIVVKATIDGEPLEFIFDTGAEITMITEEARENLGLKKIGESTTSDTHDESREHDLVVIPELMMGGVMFRNIAAGIISYPENSIIRCIARDGIIGANMISKSNWNIDFEKQLISLTDQPEQFYNRSTANRISFKRSYSGKPYINTMVNGRLVHDMLIDMGSNGAIEIPYHLKGMVDPAETREFAGLTHGIFSSSSDPVFTGYLQEVFFGDVMASNVGVIFSEKRSLKVGNEVLSNYNITLDYKRREIVLQPASSVNAKRLVMNGFGLVMARNNKGEVIVETVHENSPAHRSGIKKGDVIRKMNNEALINKFPDYCSFISWRDQVMLQDDLQLHIKGRNIPLHIQRVVRPAATVSILFPFDAAS